MRMVYLDTNVCLSWLNEEMGWNTRGLYVEAECFLKRVKTNGDTVVVSDWFFREVCEVSYWNREDVLNRFQREHIKIEVMKQVKNLNARAWTAKGIPPADATHVALALHSKCDCIVTFNKKDFQQAEDEIRVMEPNEYV